MKPQPRVITLVQGNDGNFYGTGEFGGTINNNVCSFWEASGCLHQTAHLDINGSDEGAHSERRWSWL